MKKEKIKRNGKIFVIGGILIVATSYLQKI